jgi:hypothetical protein
LNTTGKPKGDWMMKKLRAGLFRIILPVVGICILIVAVLNLSEQGTEAGPQGETGKLEKMIVASGSVAMDIDLNRLNGIKTGSRPAALRFATESDAFFTVIAFNDEFRGALPSSLGLIPQASAVLPGKLDAAYNRLVIESTQWGDDFELAVRDGQSGFRFFNIEGHLYDYEPAGRLLNIAGGRLLLSQEFAEELGRPSDAKAIVGNVAITATMRAIEITQVSNGEIASKSLPALGDPETGTVPGPDVVVGDLVGLFQPSGAVVGTQVGLAVGTDACNFGTVDLNWFANPNNDHPVIPQNMYRMSGGAGNNERFEQIGQSSVKHAFTALTQNLCQLGCNGAGGSRLGSGCSDPYSASLNAGPNLGSRAWINPYTGFFPRNDSATPNNSHSGHSHVQNSHRILTEINDLLPAQNPGATYYAESQYVTPHEYAWCQANPTQCNMFNNVSYRRYNITGGAGTGASPFSFSPAAATVRAKPAIYAWPDATVVQIEPDPGNDGIGLVAYKVSNPSPGLYRYEYAIFNQNLDRSIQSFSVPLANDAVLGSVGFHSPPQHPGWSADGTAGNAGFSNTPWAQAQTANSMTWSSETLAENPNANAIRWGTMYNFRFESNRPPQIANAVIGFFKTGDPIIVQVQAPSDPIAAVLVSGRVSTASGMGVYTARVSITDVNGNTRSRITNPFGYYRFDNVMPGATYTVAVHSKKYTFTPREVLVNNHITDLDFVVKP